MLRHFRGALFSPPSPVSRFSLFGHPPSRVPVKYNGSARARTGRHVAAIGFAVHAMAIRMLYQAVELEERARTALARLIRVVTETGTNCGLLWHGAV